MTDLTDTSVILGVYAGPHGLAGAVVRGGRILAAIQLERLIGVKRAWVTPKRRNREFAMDRIRYDHQHRLLYLDEYLPLVLDYVCQAAGVRYANVDLVALEARNLFNSDLDSAEPNADDDELEAAFADKPVMRIEHHDGHQAQAFYPSPFEEAAVVSVDGRSWGLAPGLGAPESLTVAVGKDSQLQTLYEANYSLVAEYYEVSMALFRERYAEGKTMGLAPYGDPRLLPDEDGVLPAWLHRAREYERPAWLRVAGEMSDSDLARARVPLDLTAFSGFTPIGKGQDPTPAQRRVAYLCQYAFENDLMSVLTTVRRETGLAKLAIAGGAALNCVANGKIIAATGFEQVFVYPNPGDEGLAAGFALRAYHTVAAAPTRSALRSDALGRPYRRDEVVAALARVGERVTGTRLGEEIYPATARLLADGAVVAWFQGRSEFGPRALGHRSLLGHPGLPDMSHRMNNRVKRREPWRPFAPSVLAERAGEFFELSGESPFMLVACPVRDERQAEVPAITHCDGSARVQTVAADIQPEYHRLISEFATLTGLPLVLNTSLNLKGQPIVETPDQALACLLETEIDALAMDGFLVRQR